MKGGLTGEDNVVWKKDDVGPIIILDHKNTKETEVASEDSPIPISSRQIICLLGVILVFILSVTGTVVMWGTNIIEDFIDQQLVLRNGSESFQKWANPPVPAIMRYRLFNYTNVREFELGKEPKLKVKEVGPFVFRERMKRVNLKFNGNGTITYQLQKMPEFLPKLSGASLEDEIFSINIPLMTIHQEALKNLNYFQRLTASYALMSAAVTPFVKRTARDLFYGYKDILTTLAEFKVPDVKVGILKNGILPYKMTMYTGETDVNRMAIISHYNGLDHMDYYPDEECNKIDGADGSKFPPSVIYPGSRPTLYERDACRKISLVYNESLTIWDNMPVLRYVTPDDVFSYGKDYPQNQCYCDNECPLSGVTGISHCRNGAPIFISFPHFYKGDPEYLNSVEGLEPDPEKHKLYVDIHQRVGAPLNVKIRIQVNVRMTNGLMQNILNKVEGYILPVFWLERELDEFPDDVKTVMERITFTVPMVKTAVGYICAVFAFITGLVLLVCAYIEIAALLRKDPPQPASSQTCITRL